jgi:hypothetical protein
MNVIKILGDASCGPTLHDGRYLLAYNPNTPYGTLDLTSTDDIAKAKRFADAGDLHAEWTAISKLQPTRPDGKPNRPLTGLAIELVRVDD